MFDLPGEVIGTPFIFTIVVDNGDGTAGIRQVWDTADFVRVSLTFPNLDDYHGFAYDWHETILLPHNGVFATDAAGTVTSIPARDEYGITQNGWEGHFLSLWPPSTAGTTLGQFFMDGDSPFWFWDRNGLRRDISAVNPTAIQDPANWTTLPEPASVFLLLTGLLTLARIRF